jgi:ribose transport system ATP-binding protein
MNDLDLAKIRHRLGIQSPTVSELPGPDAASIVLPILEADRVSKRFGPVRALDEVSMDFRRGEVHAIIGENGAGKSTLMKILAGIEQPDGGRILFAGKPVELKNPADAQRRGISMIHQELNLVDDLSIAENIFLGRERAVLGWVRRGGTIAAARQLLRSVGCEIAPSTKVKSLSIAEKQMVEIAKAISMRAGVLIMDEPTAVLSRREVTALFQLIARLKNDGVAIAYISHILPEVLEICDRVTVMRDGAVVETIDSAPAYVLGERGLASKMVGREMADHFPPREPPEQEVTIYVRNLTVPGKVHNVSFEVRRGEILGFAGLVGAGRTEMAEGLCGLRRARVEELLIDGQPMRIRNPRAAVRAGVAYLSEDRKGAGLTLGMSVAENTTLISLRRYCRPLISRRREEAVTQRYVDDLSIKVSDVRDPVQKLSGGNQQKVALAKWLETNPRVLIIDEPTRGVDIGAKEQIYQLIQSLTRSGMACILISSELNEVLGLSHRIAVMRGGRIVATLDAAAATEEQIMHHAAGVVGVERVAS